MIKVKKSFIEQVICFGAVRTREYSYYCEGRVDYSCLANSRDPVVYVVYRFRYTKPGESLDVRPPFEIVGLFDVHGNRY